MTTPSSGRHQFVNIGYIIWLGLGKVKEDSAALSIYCIALQWSHFLRTRQARQVFLPPGIHLGVALLHVFKEFAVHTTAH